MQHADTVYERVKERRLSRAGLLRLLNDLDAEEVTDGITLYVKPGGFQDSLRSVEIQQSWVADGLTELTPSMERSKTGAVVFLSEGTGSKGKCVAILPPFPIEQDLLLPGWDGSQLRSIMNTDHTIGVVMLRLGRYAVGVFRGTKLVSSKTDTRYVKGRHSAGGTSQKRFERIRDKQIQEIFKKTCSIVHAQFSPFEDRLDYIFLGGEKFTLQGLLKRCDYLERMSPKVVGRVLNVREPNHEALEKVIDTVWESRVFSVG